MSDHLTANAPGLAGAIVALRRAASCALALLVAVTVTALAAPTARGDGDPGSDVLVYQDLFVAADAGVSVAQQDQLGSLLQTATKAGFPIRVAIISSPADLGAITALWHKPQAYARFLGYELSLAYKQRLLVVMPNGFGFNWPGRPTTAAYRELAAVRIGSGGHGLLAASESAVKTLAADFGVRIGTSAAAGSAAGRGSPATLTATPSTVPAISPSSTAAPDTGQSTDSSAAAIAAGLAALVALFFGVRYALRRRRRGPEVGPSTGPAAPPAGAQAAGVAGGPSAPGSPSAVGRRQIGPRHILPAAGTLAVLLALISVVIFSSSGASGASQRAALYANPYLDPGTALSARAPDFTLDNQFGHPVSLSSFRGKVVLLAFTDAECTTICPMTTEAMVDAKAMLGSAGSSVQLLGVDANPASTSVEDVASYSELHGLMHSWDFLTGSLSQLRPIWKAYSIAADIERGLISHTPALMVITPQGREAKVYITQQSYAAVGQLGQILAREVSNVLPSHPQVHSNLSYQQIPGITPAQRVRLPRYGGGTVTVGADGSPRLYVFFATWDQEITGLGGDLEALNRYQAAAGTSGLPALTAVDEGQVEPYRQALPDFLDSLSQPLTYPVSIDRSGQVADGYEVLGQPWFVLASSTGKILWYQQVSTSGWPSDSRLTADVRAALARSPGTPTTSAEVSRALAGSPAPLALLHQQASHLLGSQKALDARIRSLRGYPIVINAWASWCAPCRSEFALFAAASAEYGRKVAFIGADTNDSPGDAQAFLAQHPVSYPSYQTNTSDLNTLAPVGYLPTTIYINRSGKVVYTHIGQYDDQGVLDGDIAAYALGFR